MARFKQEVNSMPNSRPNIIFIITDQQRYDTISALGFPYMDTPNLDRLVHEEVNFTNTELITMVRSKNWPV
jgi:arylsulfatase A-like enzyme